MSKLFAKTTIYLHPKVKKFLKFKAVNEGSTLSQIINNEFAEQDEDALDIKIAKRRENEKNYTF